MILEAVDAALWILRHIRALDELPVFVSVLACTRGDRAVVLLVTRDLGQRLEPLRGAPAELSIRELPSRKESRRCGARSNR